MKRLLDLNRYKYYLTHEPKLDQDRVELYSKVYENYIDQLTRDLTSDQEWSLFYKLKYKFMFDVYLNFGLTRLGNYIVYNFNIDREKYFNSN